MRKEEIDISYFAYQEWLTGYSIPYLATGFPFSFGYYESVHSHIERVEGWIRFWATDAERELADCKNPKEWMTIAYRGGTKVVFRRRWRMR